MKSFLRTLIAILFADALLLLVLVLVLGTKMKTTPDIQAGSVLVQTIDGPLPEYAPAASLPPFDTGPSHTAILENLEKARHDDKIRAVVLRIGAPDIGWAKMDEIRERISQLHDVGKPVWAYVETLNNRSLFLGAACDSLFMMPSGYVSIRGFSGEHMFVRRALDKLGVKDNLHRIGAYKSAAELVQREGLSPAARENVVWLYDVYFPNFISTVEADRRLLPGVLENEIMQAGALIPGEAANLHLVDRLLYWDEVESLLLRVRGVKSRPKSDVPGLPSHPRTVRGEDYAKTSRKKAGIHARKVIAIVHAQGLIAGEKSGYAFPFGITMGAGTMEQAFRQAASNKNVAAIVFRVDSGGGESSTSWRIGRVASLVSSIKPVVVSMVDIAASGAYMISYPCSTLVAGRLSVVGSIGSISGKFDAQGLYNKLGITKDFVPRGPNALFDSDYESYTPAQWAAFTRAHWAGYYEWVEDVARVRHLTPADVDSSGRGRVFTGQQAFERGLIDTVGTLDLALRLAKEKAGIPPSQDVEIIHYPQAQGFLDALRSGGLSAAVAILVRHAFEPFVHDATWALDWTDYSGL
jgi:protease IV